MYRRSRRTWVYLHSFVARPKVSRLVLAVWITIQLSACAAAWSDPLPTNSDRSAGDLNWRQSSSSSLASPGRNSVTLSSCPAGVIASEPAYYVYISGTGTSEAVLVEGGSCKGDGHRGTLEFTTRNTHPSGYVVGSASGGIQEASIAARFVPTNLKVSQSGRVIIPAGEYDVFAPISIRASNQTVEFAGSVLNCYTADDPCIFVGDAKSSNLFLNISLLGPRGRPMMVAGTKPFIEVNAQQTRVINLSMLWPPHGGSFGSYVQVDNDQAFLLDGLDTTLGGGGVTCNPSFCGAIVTAPGPFSRWAAVGWLKNLNLSLQCSGKGIDWVSGNGLKISDSVIQGWSVFGVRVSNQRGGYAGLIADNVYFEASPSCKQYSPFGNVGSAAVIAEGVQVKVTSLNANGPNGVFPNWGGQSGSHDWLYWVVPVHEKFGDGVPLPAGHAVNDGSGSITGTFPRIAGASSYKILKMDWDGSSYPHPYPRGTGKYLLTTVQPSSCATLTCSFRDSGQELASYSNAGENSSANMYMPRLDFWPGAIVMSPGEDMSAASYSVPVLPLEADVLAVGAIVTTQPAWAIAGEANTVMLYGGAPSSAANIEALHTSGIGPIPGATIMPVASLPAVATSGHKGRLNFGQHGQINGFTPVITLGDSDWGKTWAMPGHRPSADVNDLDLGYEGNIDVFYNRAQNEIREYVGKFPDGKPQEKLTASAKSFNVPVTIHGDLTVTGKCEGCGSGAGKSGRQPGGASVSLTDQRAGIPTTTLCSSSTCGSGQYRIDYYLDSTTTCESPGSAMTELTMGWKDETGARTLRVPLTGMGVSGGVGLGLGAVTNFGSGSISLWSSGDTPITYATSFKGCGAGDAGYAVRIAIEKAQ